MSGSITPLTITVNPYAASSHGGSRCANVPQARIEHTHVSRVVKDTQASEHLAHDSKVFYCYGDEIRIHSVERVQYT